MTHALQHVHEKAYAHLLHARQENCEHPSAKVVVPQAAREARCNTMTEQHGDGHNPTPFPTE